MKSASHSLLNSLDVMCVLCIICYRMQEGWAHVCPFIMWCHEKKKLCSLAAVKAEKDKRSEPDLSLWIYLYRVITAQSVLP